MFSLKRRAIVSELPDKIPEHVAIIMDGNGRWAESRSLPRKVGHQQGAEALRTLIEGISQTGVNFLTLYAFSSENWNRPENEVSDLMELLRYYLQREVKTLHENNVRLKFIGDRTQLSDDIRLELVNAERLTKNNTGLCVVMALSYGSRQELVRAVKEISTRVKAGELSVDAIDEALVLENLDTTGIPDPDLLIRTGGDQRLSNFLLWQSAYTELYFTPVLWPDFNQKHFEEALHDFGQRERRFGARPTS